jgi:hypothetical protein
LNEIALKLRRHDRLMTDSRRASGDFGRLLCRPSTRVFELQSQLPGSASFDEREPSRVRLFPQINTRSATLR